MHRYDFDRSGGAFMQRLETLGHWFNRHAPPTLQRPQTTWASVPVIAGFSPGATISTPETEFVPNVPFSTAGGNGLPVELTTDDFPTIGNNVTLDVANLPVAPTIGLQVVGFQQTNTPLDPLGGTGCWLLSSADILSAGLVNTSNLSYSLQLPSLPQLIG